MILSLFYVIAFNFYLLSHFDRVGLYVIAFSFYLLSHFDKIGLYVLTLDFCYLIVMNFTASSILSYYCIVMFCLNREN